MRFLLVSEHSRPSRESMRRFRRIDLVCNQLRSVCPSETECSLENLSS